MAMMTRLNNLPRRFLPVFYIMEDDDDLTQTSKGIHEEFVHLPPGGEETIFQAVRLNDVNKVSMMLRHGTDVNTVHEGDPCLVKSPSLFRNIHMKKYCPLHVAVLHSQIETIELLCSHGADIDHRDGNDRTPLFLATAAVRLDVMKFLIGKGANVNAQTSSKRTALIDAVCLDRFYLVDQLLRSGSDPNLEDIKGTTALGQCVMMPQVSMKILNRLLEAGSDVNRANIKGATPLMFAVSMKMVDKIQALIDAGAEINAVDSQMMTAFHLATSDGQGIHIARLLMKHGAHPDLKNKQGKTPLDMAVTQGKLKVLQMLLLSDCDRDYSLLTSEMVKVLCDKVPVFRKWLMEEMYNPKSLKRLCRGTIRSCLSGTGLSHVDQLPLPTTLRDFMWVKYFQ